MSPEPERLAWSVLRTANRTQAKGSTARIVVPRDPEMVDELGRERGVIPTDEDLLSAEEYLEEHGYLAPTDIGLTRGTYTITPAGLRWIEEDSPRLTETPHTTGERAEETQLRRSSASREDRQGPEPGTGVAGTGVAGTGVAEDRPGGARGVRRPWWRRVLGG
jgi:hypothetical protein